ncbi:AraC family transcriptional regulator [Micromonospora sp. NPDC047812]|uniref:AraC family transcriptional regulator n=1 Tax=Micromonospora sp. NPDC047812 TaxID=3155742 RepID=UPI00345682E2
MDPLSGMLDGPRARGAFLLRSLLDPPFALRIEDRAPLTVVALVHGTAWVVPDDGAPAALGPGDVAVLRGPDGYLVADDPATAPQVVVHPGQRCTTLRGEPLAEAMTLGVRTWGTGADGSTVLLTGTYQLPGELGRRLLTALPPLLVVGGEDRSGPLVSLLADEVARDAPGQEIVLDRLLDLVLIAALRTWFARPGAAPAWYVAAADPVVGPALRLLRDDPARPWTVAALAAEVGVSRAALARRFTELVGEPPMTFLTGWRLALAADLLREPDATLGAVAREVGYGSPFALSSAFRRVHGVSPRDHRLAR